MKSELFHWEVPYLRDNAPRLQPQFFALTPENTHPACWLARILAQNLTKLAISVSNLWQNRVVGECICWQDIWSGLSRWHWWYCKEIYDWTLLFWVTDIRPRFLQPLFGSEMGLVMIYVMQLGLGLRNSVDMSNSKVKISWQTRTKLFCKRSKRLMHLSHSYWKPTLNGEPLTSERLRIFYV